MQLAGLIQAVEYLAGINILHGDLKPVGCFNGYTRRKLIRFR
jgi:hypothetical protein